MTVSRHDRKTPWTRHVASQMMRAMEDYREQVGARLLRLRESKNMTQEDAAHLIGVAVKTWHNWESGKRSPYESNWRRIGEKFEVDVAIIRGRQPTPLGLDGPDQESESQLDRIERRLDEIYALLTGDPVRESVPEIGSIVDRLTRTDEQHPTPARGATQNPSASVQRKSA